MKGDFTRETFNPVKHYQQVRMQQGRAQTDADANEQAAICARRDETTTADIIGDCGGPENGAAFAVFTDPNKLTAAEKEHLQDLQINLPLAKHDFFLSAGRYYVDGIQCENEWAVSYTTQPDRFDVISLDEGKSYLLYLDVWQRHITSLEDGQIREVALGGPDTGTRVKTVWQVRTLPLEAVDPKNPCGSGANNFNQLFDPGTARLTADTARDPAQNDPCVVPPGAGYTGLENQLYRVEIHEAGTALDGANNAGSTDVTLPGANNPANQITVKGGAWAVGAAVELYPSKAGSPPLKGQIAWITAVNNKVLTLNTPVTGFVEDDKPRLRAVGATWKWSRENGSVVTSIEKIDGNKITVGSLGPDRNLGFLKDAWVEILDDARELDGTPGQLAQIDDVDEAMRLITLKSDAAKLAANADGVLPARHPRLRRWEGVAAVKFAANPDDNWLPLENGVQVQFASNGNYRTGHFWQIPARTATARTPNGDIEWPVDKDHRIAQPPRGITHHFCRLGIVTLKNDGSLDATDCRCLYPRLTAVPRLCYVSGDGQEVMPDLTKPGDLFPLAEPLIVGVANLHANSKVRFMITEGNGRVAGDGQFQTGLNAFIDVKPSANGQAICHFSLEAATHHQQVTATVLDPDCGGVPLPILFNANLSIAGEVAYDPGTCGGLQDQKTVQDALSHLATMISIYKISGEGQQAAAGATLGAPLVVRVANRCGPVAQIPVIFKAILGGGSVTPNAAATDANGEVSCNWQLGKDSTLQVVLAQVAGDADHPATEPREVHFVAHLAGEGSDDPAPVRVLDVQLRHPARSLANGEQIQMEELRAGLAVVCDRIIDESTVLDPASGSDALIVRGQPTCFVTAEIPYPIMPSEVQDLGHWNSEELIGYRPLVLHGEVATATLDPSEPLGDPKPRGQILWKPGYNQSNAGGPLAYLDAVLNRFALRLKPFPLGLLLRLTLKGNFIWSNEARSLFESGNIGGFLDGEALRATPGFDPSELVLPSGDHRRGGDFEMWFWLVPKLAPQPPSITFQPVSLTVAAGQPATLRVEAKGTPPLSYQWVKNGNDIAGAKESLLTFEKVNFSDDAEYFAKVSNSAGSVQTTPVKLTVV